MSSSYSPYQQQPAPGYYNSHEAQPQPEGTISYDISHQQQQQQPNPQGWSNGYYHPQSQSPPYQNHMMNPYPMSYSDGSNSMPQQSAPPGPPPPNQVIPQPNQGLPQPNQGLPQPNQSSHYAYHQPPPQQSQQWPPYDGRGSSMSSSYSPYQQQPVPGYYSPHEVQPQPEVSISYDMSHQQPQTPQPQTTQHPQQQPNPQGWSNGYYHPQSQPPPYQNHMMNPYPMSYSDGSNSMPQQSAPPGPPPPNQVIPQPNQGLPQPSQGLLQPNQPSHYVYHQQPPQQSQQWPQQNHNMPIIERNNQPGNKKPVKPRAPKRQSNPNAPSERRKKASINEADIDGKKSAYTVFYNLKQKEFKGLDFGDVSKKIAELWADLSEEDKSFYTKEVGGKRKAMLKKKASQQAQDLLIQGIKPDQNDMIHRIKDE